MSLGGKRVRLVDPNGFLVEAVHGIEQLPGTCPQCYDVNTGGARRKGEFVRLEPPAQCSA